MGSDAEYMYENGLDPFYRIDENAGGLVEWEGGLNPAYDDDDGHIEPKRVVVDDYLYQLTLESVYSGNLDNEWVKLVIDHLVTENHVFAMFEEAANASRELAVKTQSAVKMLINHEQNIYSIYDPEMKNAIQIVADCRDVQLGIDGFFPAHPLIKQRDEDILHQENCDPWHFVAHPNGTTENLKQSICSCDRCSSGKWIAHRFCLLRELRNKSGTRLHTICQRDEVFNKALEQAKADQMKIYVIRHDTLESTSFYSRHGGTYYVTTTEKDLIEEREKIKLRVKELEREREREKELEEEREKERERDRQKNNEETGTYKKNCITIENFKINDEENYKGIKERNAYGTVINNGDRFLRSVRVAVYDLGKVFYRNHNDFPDGSFKPNDRKDFKQNLDSIYYGQIGEKASPSKWSGRAYAEIVEIYFSK